MKRSLAAAIMADVPRRENYENEAAALTALVVSKLPAKVRAVWDDAELRGFIRTTPIYSYGVGVSLPDGTWDAVKDSPEAEAFELAAKRYYEEDSQRRVDRGVILRTLGQVRTVKQLRESFPEFAKYLPENRTAAAAGRKLPIDRGIIERLKSLGWSQ
jgi:hypothetical protein